MYKTRAMRNERVIDSSADAGEVVSLYDTLVVLNCEVDRPIDLIRSRSEGIRWVAEWKFRARLSAFVVKACVRVGVSADIF